MNNNQIDNNQIRKEDDEYRKRIFAVPLRKNNRQENQLRNQKRRENLRSGFQR